MFMNHKIRSQTSKSKSAAELLGPGLGSSLMLVLLSQLSLFSFMVRLEVEPTPPDPCCSCFTSSEGPGAVTFLTSGSSRPGLHLV